MHDFILLGTGVKFALLFKFVLVESTIEDFKIIDMMSLIMDEKNFLNG